MTIATSIGECILLHPNRFDVFVQVVETMGFRVVRHWLNGPKKGQSETFLEFLPGFPDGVTRSE